jgi:hypothetical protein
MMRAFPALIIIVTGCFLVLFNDDNKMVHSSWNTVTTAFKNAIGTAGMNTKGEMNHEIGTALKTNNITCTWRPGSNEECFNLLSGLPPSARNWNFFGDSTMMRLYRTVQPVNYGHPQLWKRCGCKSKTTTRCDMASKFGFEKREPWIRPNKSKGEGPTMFGLHNPHCHDCANCTSEFVECRVACPQLVTVSYFSVEFARDVEIQSQVANTTQEHVALYLKRRQQVMGGGTVCVVNAGIHDAKLGLTVDAYVENVRWYLSLLHPAVCQNIIWLATTAPRTEKQVQKTNILRKWNEAVAEMLTRHIEFSHSCLITLKLPGYGIMLIMCTWINLSMRP